MIAREVLALKRLNQLHHIELTCLPAMWHFHPDRIPAGLDEAIERARRDGVDDILIGYADCGTGGALDEICARHGVRRIEGPHCFAFYQGVENAAELAEYDMTSFFVTDFLARQPDAFLYEPLGLDRHPELTEMYFGSYERVVYLAQTNDPELQRSSEAIAARLSLPLERRFTGYGDLEREIASISR